MRTALAVMLLGIALAGGPPVEASVDPQCKSDCLAAFQVFRERCGIAPAGPARSACVRAARRYKRCCLKKICKTRQFTDLGQCVAGGA